MDFYTPLFAPQSRWGSLVDPTPTPLPCYGPHGCHPGQSWCPCGWEKGKNCPKLEWPEKCDACEQYPEKPTPPTPDPNQLTFGW